MNPPLLQHLSADQLEHELRGFPDGTLASVIALREDPSASRLETAVLQILAFYLPKGKSRDLTVEPVKARLREDLGIDSLTFAEAAFKLEELFDVRIENAEFSEVHTMGDLREFAREKFLGL